MSGIYQLAYIMIGSLLVYGRWLISELNSLDKAVASTIEVVPLPDDGGSYDTGIHSLPPPSIFKGRARKHLRSRQNFP